MNYDVFNGDADGICALHQLRLAEPREAELVTGVKRDIALLERVRAGRGDRVTVCDISLARNREALGRVLAAGARVDYFDHHYAGDIPADPGLAAVIDLSPEVCTSILVDRHLGGRHRAWAVVAAFGDNLPRVARALAATLSLSEADVEVLRTLGECLNYNAYGARVEELLYPPATLYRLLHRYGDPLRFAADEPVLDSLRRARDADLERALALRPDLDGATAVLYRLPDAPWSRRAMGSFANRVAQTETRRALAVLVPDGAGGYQVSLRVPAGASTTADAICRRFGGGGRALAGGIDALPETEFSRFAAVLEESFGGA